MFQKNFFLKIVRDRRLYLVNERSRRYVHTPICVLDFYIHSSVQHHGCGLELLNRMLKVFFLIFDRFFNSIIFTVGVNNTAEMCI